MSRILQDLMTGFVIILLAFAPLFLIAMILDAAGVPAPPIGYPIVIAAPR